MCGGPPLPGARWWLMGVAGPERQANEAPGGRRRDGSLPRRPARNPRSIYRRDGAWPSRTESDSALVSAFPAMSGPAERLRRLLPTLQAEAGAALGGRDAGAFLARTEYQFADAHQALDQLYGGAHDLDALLLRLFRAML